MLWEKYKFFLENEGLSKNRIDKIKTMFNSVSRNLDLSTAKREDIEEYLNDLNKDNIKKVRNNDNFSATTKSDLKKFLKQFFKHTKGHDEFYPREVSWIKTRIPKDQKPEEKPVLELKEVEKLAQKFLKYDYKMAVLLLFDSGFRIQELMSCKKSDLTWEEFNQGEKCFWLKCNKSKTFSRKIPVPLFTTELRAFFESSYFKSKNAEDLLFDIHYDSFRRTMAKYSLEMFRKNITPHCLRHSSATYYAKEYSGNVPLLAQRFGWSYSAKELQTYVRHSGSYNKEGAKVSYNNNMTKLLEEIEHLKEKEKNWKIESDKKNRELEELKKRTDRIERLMITNKEGGVSGFKSKSKPITYQRSKK